MHVTTSILLYEFNIMCMLLYAYSYMHTMICTLLYAYNYMNMFIWIDYYMFISLCILLYAYDCMHNSICILLYACYCMYVITWIKYDIRIMTFLVSYDYYYMNWLLHTYYNMHVSTCKLYACYMNTIIWLCIHEVTIICMLLYAYGYINISIWVE